MNRAMSKPESASTSMPRSRAEWDRLQQTRQRRGAVAGRLVRPPTRRWCDLRGRGYTVARLEGVDSDGVEVEVALISYDDGVGQTLPDRRSAPVGAVIFAMGQIESTDWAPSSLRMVVEHVWAIDKRPRLVSVGELVAKEEVMRKFTALERAKSERHKADSAVDCAFH